MSSVYASECSTLAKRKALTARIEAAIAPFGATLEFDDKAYADYHGREVTVSIGPWRFGISLWGRSNVSAYVVHIYTDTASDARLPANFGAALGNHDAVNPYHRRKATLVESTYPAMEMGLVYGLKCLREALDHKNAE